MLCVCLVRFVGAALFVCITNTTKKNIKMKLSLFIVNPSINRIGLSLWPCLTTFLLLNPTLYTKVQDVEGRLVQTTPIW